MRASPGSPTPTRPFFSIITISFNAQNLIGPTLQSVVDQPEVDGLVEHWVVDGASQDGTLDVVRQSPHVHYISEPDKGITDAFNKRMHLASGEYIIYLNCDDIFCDNRVLADLYASATGQKFPAWIVGQWYARRLNGNIELVKPRLPLAGWNLFRDPRICHQAVVLRLAAQREIKVKAPNFPLAMDYDSCARLYQAGYDITRFNRPLVVFVDGGFSARNDDLARHDHGAVQKRLRNTLLKRWVGKVYDQVGAFRAKRAKAQGD